MAASRRGQIIEYELGMPYLYYNGILGEGFIDYWKVKTII